MILSFFSKSMSDTAITHITLKWSQYGHLVDGSEILPTSRGWLKYLIGPQPVFFLHRILLKHQQQQGYSSPPIPSGQNRTFPISPFGIIQLIGGADSQGRLGSKGQEHQQRKCGGHGSRWSSQNNADARCEGFALSQGCKVSKVKGGVKFGGAASWNEWFSSIDLPYQLVSQISVAHQFFKSFISFRIFQAFFLWLPNKLYRKPPNQSPLTPSFLETEKTPENPRPG